MFLKVLKAIAAFFVDFIETGVLALLFFVFMYVFLFRPHQVKGNSMFPNFHDAEYLLTNKIVYQFYPVKRGDVVIFKAPQNEEYDYIKRIVGLPGETVIVANGQVYADNRPLNENDYLSPQVKTAPGLFLTESKKITVPENEYVVLGDNRDFSSDSRDWGTVPKGSIIGKAWFRYWPLSEMGLIKGH